MELLHSLFGLVRSPFLTTFLQVFSRFAILFGISNLSEKSQNHWSFVTMVLAWCSVEVIRYSYYAVLQVSVTSIPYFLLYLRYSVFLLLYPIGILSEILQTLHALPELFINERFNINLPNQLNFGFNYAICFGLGMLLYIPGSPLLFKYMQNERKKKLV